MCRVLCWLVSDARCTMWDERWGWESEYDKKVGISWIKVDTVDRGIITRVYLLLSCPQLQLTCPQTSSFTGSLYPLCSHPCYRIFYPSVIEIRYCARVRDGITPYLRRYNVDFFTSKFCTCTDTKEVVRYFSQGIQFQPGQLLELNIDVYLKSRVSSLTPLLQNKYKKPIKSGNPSKLETLHLTREIVTPRKIRCINISSLPKDMWSILYFRDHMPRPVHHASWSVHRYDATDAHLFLPSSLMTAFSDHDLERSTL